MAEITRVYRVAYYDADADDRRGMTYRQEDLYASPDTPAIIVAQNNSAETNRKVTKYQEDYADYLAAAKAHRESGRPWFEFKGYCPQSPSHYYVEEVEVDP